MRGKTFRRNDSILMRSLHNVNVSLPCDKPLISIAKLATSKEDMKNMEFVELMAQISLLFYFHIN